LETVLIKAAIVGCLVFFISACSEKIPDKSKSDTFTLASRVELAKIEDCGNSGDGSLSVSKKGATYSVHTSGVFFCNSAVKPPYLTLPKDGKATLILDSISDDKGCECFRSVHVEISDRLEQGQTLYVLNNGEVIGHVVLP
jgi:hypothetical protein